MGRTRVLTLAGVGALLSLWLPGPALAAAAPCDFRLGFKAIHDQLPAQVGACLDNETYNSSGDSVQHTAGGMLAWRHADNWTAFTDGFHTWVDGPYGLQERLNSVRFPWEHDMDTSGSTTSSNTSTTSRTSCTAVATSGSVSATGLNSSTTIISDGSGTSVTTSGNGTTTISSSSSDGGGTTTTTVITNSSTSSSTPGVATSGC